MFASGEPASSSHAMQLLAKAEPIKSIKNSGKANLIQKD
jgi:hypothetical protein